MGLGTALSLAGDLTLYAVLPSYAQTRAFDLAMIGLILSANRLVRLGSNPIVGFLLAGAKRRKFILSGFGLGAVSTLLYVLASGPALFLLGRLLWGICWSLIYIGSYCMLLDITDARDHGWGSGILQGFTFLGLAVNPLLGGLLSDRLGFTNALTICAAMTGVGFLIALFFLPETHTMRPQAYAASQNTERALLEENDPPPVGKKTLYARLAAAIRPLLHFQNLSANFIFLATNFIGEGILLSTLSLHVFRQYGDALQIGPLQIHAATAGGALLALRAGVSALVAPLAGRLSDKAHNRWSAIAWGIGITAIGMFLVGGFDTLTGLVAGIILAASGGALVITIIPPLTKEINPGSESGTILGLLATSADFGMALAPLAAYTLVESLSLPVIYRLAGLTLACGLPLIWFAQRKRQP